VYEAPTETGYITPNDPKSDSIGAILAGFKLASTKKANLMRHSPGMSLCQRNYYEHVIRSEKEYLTIEGFIQNNPANWIKDTYHI